MQMIIATMIFDGGTHVAGVKADVETKMLAIGPTALFTACGCHNCDLLLDDALTSLA
jgi:hypothetical protein